MTQLRLFPWKPKPQPVAPPPLLPKEKLVEIFHDLNRRYFSGAVEAAIRWGRYGHRRRRVRRRTIRLGSYFFQSRVIRIHPILAQDWIPRPVLETVIHHEMCHATAPTQKHGHTRRHHHAEFRGLEREFEHHAWTQRWLKENLDRMLKTLIR